MDSHLQRAKEVISKIEYITIASFNYKERKPWITPVFASFDEGYNFYWVSAKTALHSENIRANNEVAISIYNSIAPEGTGMGVYIEAVVFELDDEKQIAHAEQLLARRAGKSVRDIYYFVDNSQLRMYKAVPQKVWVNDEEKINGQTVDAQVEIGLLPIQNLIH